MKKYFRISCMIFAVFLTLSACSVSNAEDESSFEQVSVINRELTAYERNAMKDAVEIPLENACTTLYECVCKGSVTKSSALGKFSFSDMIPEGNASPAQKIKAANLLTLRNAVEYFELEEIYTNENIKQYGYMTASYTDAGLIKGTVVNISSFEKLSNDFARFESMDMKLGDFINGKLLMS